MSDDPIFKKYAKQYSSNDSFSSGSDLKILMKFLPERMSNALDIATGTGFVALELSKRSESVVALDKTEAMISEARKLISSKRIGNVRFVVSDFYSFDSALKFDAITCRRALHHFDKKDLFFRKSRDLLRDDGILAISDMMVPETDTSDLFNELERRRDPTHSAALNEKEFLFYFKSAGFRIVSSKVESEEMSFEKWIYPVETNSHPAIECKKFINTLSDKDLETIGYNRGSNSITKKRFIVTAKPE